LILFKFSTDYNSGEDSKRLLSEGQIRITSRNYHEVRRTGSGVTRKL
jgi:hypothetical protein